MTRLRHFVAAVLALLNAVGFREVRPLSVAGQWFIIAYLIPGLGSAGFAVACMTAFVLQGESRNMRKGRRLDRRILQLRDHNALRGSRTGWARLGSLAGV